MPIRLTGRMLIAPLVLAYPIAAPFLLPMAASSVAASSVVAQEEAAPTDEATRMKLAEMLRRDQEIREKITPLFAKADRDQAEFLRLAQEMAVIDEENLKELERIIERVGWPTSDRFGEDGSRAAFLIVQHAPFEAQQKYLPLLREAVAKGGARGSDLALLEDRVLVREGKQQRYGSQVSFGADGTPRLDPVEDPATLDERRKSVGLPPIADYLKLLEEQIGKPIDRSVLDER